MFSRVPFSRTPYGRTILYRFILDVDGVIITEIDDFLNHKESILSEHVIEVDTFCIQSFNDAVDTIWITDAVILHKLGGIDIVLARAPPEVYIDDFYHSNYDLLIEFVVDVEIVDPTELLNVNYNIDIVCEDKLNSKDNIYINNIIDTTVVDGFRLAENNLIVDYLIISDTVDLLRNYEVLKIDYIFQAIASTDSDYLEHLVVDFLIDVVPVFIQAGFYTFIVENVIEVSVPSYSSMNDICDIDIIIEPSTEKIKRRFNIKQYYLVSNIDTDYTLTGKRNTVFTLQGTVTTRRV